MSVALEGNINGNDKVRLEKRFFINWLQTPFKLYSDF